jgi:hypothetical protein
MQIATRMEPCQSTAYRGCPFLYIQLPPYRLIWHIGSSAMCVPHTCKVHTYIRLHPVSKYCLALSAPYKATSYRASKSRLDEARMYFGSFRSSSTFSACKRFRFLSHGLDSSFMVVLRSLLCLIPAVKVTTNFEL